MLHIGEIELNPDGTVKRVEKQFYGQGLIIKDEDAYKNHPDKPCYVPELADEDVFYTRNDFLRQANGQEEFSDMLFYSVDWQHPETLFDENLRNGEWGYCEHCKKLIDLQGESVTQCPKCGKDL